MDQLTPIYRIEFFLDTIVNNSANDLDPIYRVEFFLAKIAGREVEIPDPLSRMEIFLAKLCGESVELPEPKSRTEQYLAAICGEDVEIPPFPVYRIEYWLDQWVQGGGGSYITLVGDIVRFMASRSAPFRKLQIALEPIQDLHGYDSPWPAGGGKNLVPPLSDWQEGYIASNGVLAQQQPTTLELTSPYILCAADQNYTFSYSLTGEPTVSGTANIYWSAICFYDVNEQMTGTRITSNGQPTKYDLTGTAPSDARYFRVSFRGYGIAKNAQTEKGSTATAYSPYSNICPISGHTSADVTRTGKNLAPFLTDYLTAEVDMNGNANWSDVWKVPDRAKTYSYTVYIDNRNAVGKSRATIWLKGEDGVSFTDGIARGWNEIPAGGVGYSTVTVDMSTVPNTYYLTPGLSLKKNGIASNPLLELGSTASAYEPYAGNTYNVTFPALGKNLVNNAALIGASYNKYNCPNFLKNNTTYTYSVYGSTEFAFGVFVGHTNEAVPQPNIRISATYQHSGQHETFTTPADVEDYEYLFFGGGRAGAGTSDVLFQIELGTVASPTYEPYTNTIYGGTLDVTAGTLTVDRAMVDLGTLTYGVTGSSRFYNVTRVSNFKFATSSAERASGMLCSCYPFSSNLSFSDVMDDNSMLRAQSTQGYDFVIRDTTYGNDPALFKTAMSGVQLCYELATPITIQLTPQAINSLVGENNVWDDGTVTVEVKGEAIT